MIRILVLFLLQFFLLNISNGYSIVDNKPRRFYVAPYGSDLNPGTKTRPWKSFAKVARSVVAGDTALFEDGVYVEDNAIKIKNSGHADSPIVIKSVNIHGAKILFTSRLKNAAKLRIVGKMYIEIRDFELLQEQRSTFADIKRTSDMMIVCSGGSENVVISRNKIGYCFEDGIKVGSSKNILIIDNVINDIEHEGIDVVNSESVVIEGNQINEIGRCGVLVKGRSRNSVIYNNVISNKIKTMKGHGIALGGETKFKNLDSKGRFYEAYNIYALSNVVVAQKKGTIKWGISFIGAYDCYAYNNVIVGSDFGFAFYSPNGLKNGWSWNPIVTNAYVTNNVLFGVKTNSFYQNHAFRNINVHNNLYYGSKDNASDYEKDGIFHNPLFIDPYSNWSLMEGSPAIGRANFLDGKILNRPNLGSKYYEYERVLEEFIQILNLKRNIGILRK